MTQLPVLVVDDNEDDLLLLKIALGRAPNLRIAGTVGDGDQALEFLKSQPSEPANRAALVLLDLNMPRRDGFQTLEAMKRDPRLCTIPVVILTTSSQEEDLLRAYQLGAASYIRKPVDTSDFFALLELFGKYWSHVSDLPNT